MSKQIEPHVLEYYEQKKLLGSGAYGHVWKVTQKQTKKTFALKKIFDAFQNSTDAQRTYRQISLLHQMQNKYIVKLHKVIKSKNKKDLYLVFQFMQSDLHSLVGQGILTPNHIVFVLYQILKALKYCHSAQLIHRDLKPSNVLINSDCQIKLCDFGLARSLVCQQNQQNILSEEVATRWYRSPEILLSSHDYSKPTDIWSVGCIVAQLMIGQPIFQGTSTLNQLQKIIQFTGMPSKYSIDSLKSQVAQNVLNSISVRKKSVRDYFRKFKNENPYLVDLTIDMLEFNPNKRPTVEKLLESKIFREFQSNDAQQEEICQKFIIPQIDDNVKLTLKQYRSIIYKDIQRRYPQFNDQTRIKSIYSNIQKTKSFMEKSRKNSLKTPIHSSFYQTQSKSHSKKQDASLTKNLKSTNKSQSYSKFKQKKHAHKSEMIEHKEFKQIKAKFCKITKQKPKLQVMTVNNSNQNKQFVKQAVKSELTTSVHPSQTPPKNHRSKQNSLIGCHPPPQEKASVYKTELKKMKSSKNLVKVKAKKSKIDYFGANKFK